MNDSNFSTDIQETIVSRFQNIATYMPAAVAVKSNGIEVTYEELDTRSDRLASVLQQIDQGHGERILILAPQGELSIVAILAVLKTGRCYSFINTKLKIEQQRQLLFHFDASIILCDPMMEEIAVELVVGRPDISVVNISRLHKGETLKLGDIPIKASDAACVLYTSGSTGVPKGVVLSHEYILHMALVHGKEFSISVRDRSTQMCPLWTAAAASEIFTSLLSGASLFPISLIYTGLHSFQKLLNHEEITTIAASPVVFRLLFESAVNDYRAPTVRLVRLGGDRVTSGDLEIFRRVFTKECALRIGYGSTEFLPASQFIMFPGRGDAPTEEIPIGYSMPGCEILLLDEHGNEVKPGEEGEVAVVSKYLSLGYWRDEELTNKKYRHCPEFPGLRMYLTNDIARRSENGILYFMGRKDFMIKLNGQIISILEIEKSLISISYIKDAAVVEQIAENQATRLVAFIVSEGKSLEMQKLWKELSGLLPYEAMPSALIKLDELPYTSNNKVDRQRLMSMCV